MTVTFDYRQLRKDFVRDQLAKAKDIARRRDAIGFDEYVSIVDRCISDYSRHRCELTLHRYEPYRDDDGTEWLICARCDTYHKETP